MDILNWWNNLLPLSEEEIKILHRPLSHTKDSDEALQFYMKPKATNDQQWEKFKQKFFNKLFMPSKIQDRQLAFEESATTFINYLFDKYVDDNTLIISTDSEHPSVKKCLVKYKNKYILNFERDIITYSIDKILFEAKKYKKVFVYIIGTKNATGEITPQEFFVQLKQKFEKNNIFYTLVLDDVQGMFLVPRDYSIFDYIIGTAHALCPGYDMGIMLSKYFEFGKKAYNWGEEYLKHLDIMLKRRNKINIFKTVMLSYYKKHLNIDNKLANSLSVPYIFYFTIKDLNFTQKTTDLLHKFNLLIPAYDFSPITFVHMRCHEFIYNKSLLPHTISILNFILENKAVLNEKTLNSYIENELIKMNLF